MKEQAEQELKDLIAKYPTLEFFVTRNENFAVGFKEKEIPVVIPEVVPVVTPIENTVVVDAPTVDAELKQP